MKTGWTLEVATPRSCGCITRAKRWSSANGVSADRTLVHPCLRSFRRLVPVRRRRLSWTRCCPISARCQRYQLRHGAPSPSYRPTSTRCQSLSQETCNVPSRIVSSGSGSFHRGIILDRSSAGSGSLSIALMLPGWNAVGSLVRPPSNVGVAGPRIFGALPV